jgi:hypothetical protein
MTTAASIDSGSLSENFWNFNWPEWLLSQPSISEPELPRQLIRDVDLLEYFRLIPGLKELLMLRQVHALEHATVWILSNSSAKGQSSVPAIAADDAQLGGMATERGFYLYGRVNWLDLQRAAKQALERLTQGEWQLAVHPRCGTNMSVEMLLMSGLTLGAHLLLPREPVEQILGMGFAAATAAQLAPEIGSLVQRYLMTASPLNLELADITFTTDPDGYPAHFVGVQWVRESSYA